LVSGGVLRSRCGRPTAEGWWRGGPGSACSLFWPTVPGRQEWLSEEGALFPYAWTPDGRELLCEGMDGNIWSVSFEGPEPRLTRLLKGMCPALSPDGRWLAYVPDPLRHEVHVRPFPSLDERWQISIDSGSSPLWSRDGRELFFIRRGDPAMMVVDIATTPAFSPGRPRQLFDARRFMHSPHARNYDVTADGKRFLMIESPTEPGLTPPADRIHIVLNWFVKLKEVFGGS
jgi:Tol biopolymer transport system component